MKINNCGEIRQLAADTVRMANAEHPMLEETYEKLVNAGINTPYYTQMALKNAEYDSYIMAAGEFANSEISYQDYMGRYKRTRSTLSILDKSPVGKQLYDSMKSFYEKYADIPEMKKAYVNGKKNMQRRIAVLSGLAEGSKKLVPCSLNKGIKKFTYRFLRLINR